MRYEYVEQFARPVERVPIRSIHPQYVEVFGVEYRLIDHSSLNVQREQDGYFTVTQTITYTSRPPNIYEIAEWSEE